MKITNIIKHLNTINLHRREVRKGCFKIGLYKQGLLHDFSKYSPSEFWVGVRFYQGYRSPNNAERELYGYSSSWLHHKGRNKHHYEYWVDYSMTDDNGTFVPVKMPRKYVAEMCMDRIAASKIYKGKDYNDNCPLEYFYLGKGKVFINEETANELEFMLSYLAKNGENKLYEYIKKDYLKNEKIN